MSGTKFFSDECHSNGSYCYFEPTANADSFSCDNECAVDFYTAAHNYPASAKMFNYYWLISRGSWWAGEFATGWTRLTEVCGVVGDNSTASSNTTETHSMETSTGIATATPSGVLSTETGTTSASTATALGGTVTISAASSTSTSKSSPTASANAGTCLGAGNALGGAFASLLYSCFFV